MSVSSVVHAGVNNSRNRVDIIRIEFKTSCINDFIKTRIGSVKVETLGSQCLVRGAEAGVALEAFRVAFESGPLSCCGHRSCNVCVFILLGLRREHRVGYRVGLIPGAFVGNSCAGRRSC